MLRIVLLLCLLVSGCRPKDKPILDHNGPNDDSPPVAPTSLQATVIAENVVRVTWLDPNDYESHYVISHGLLGETATVDTLPANTTAFTDSVNLLNGMARYYVQAVNEHGVSAWAGPADAGQRLCQEGLIPLCVYNTWRYVVSGDHDPDTLSRRVLAREEWHGRNFWAVLDSAYGNTATHSRYYLANDEDTGTLWLPYPADTAAIDTLFRYGNAGPGQYTICGTDCVLVLISPPGVSRTVRGRTFTGVVAYQRFFDGNRNRSVQYYVQPDSVGIISEHEYEDGSNTRTRELYEWTLAN